MENINHTPCIKWMNSLGEKDHILFLSCGALRLPIAAVDFNKGTGRYDVEIKRDNIVVDGKTGEWNTPAQGITFSSENLGEVEKYMTKITGINSSRGG